MIFCCECVLFTLCDPHRNNSLQGPSQRGSLGKQNFGFFSLRIYYWNWRSGRCLLFCIPPGKGLWHYARYQGFSKNPYEPTLATDEANQYFLIYGGLLLFTPGDPLKDNLLQAQPKTSVLAKIKGLKQNVRRPLAKPAVSNKKCECPCSNQ